MAEPGLTDPALSPAARQLLEGWLDQLCAALPGRGRLRERIVAELRDGLHSAAEHHLEAGTEPVDPVDAARTGAVASR